MDKDGVFLSDYLQMYEGLEVYDVFDAIIDADSHYFINIVRLNATTPEFTGSYQRINDYFSDIATLLNSSRTDNKADKLYKSALNRFKFSEVNGINLGFSQSGYGAGFGPQLREQVIHDAW